MSAPVRIDVCGNLAITVGGERREGEIRRQGRMLLAFLALNRARPVSRDELVLAIWGEETAGHHRADLNGLLSKVRRVIGHDAIEMGRASVQLAHPIGVDYHEAVRGLEDAQAALNRSALDEASAHAERALHLAERGVLHGETAGWLDEPRRQLSETGLRARECLAEAALRRGGPHVQTAVDHAHEIVKAEPYRESAYALLMRSLEAQGNVAEALGAYEQLRRRLRDELGVSPGPSLRALHQRLLSSHDAAAHTAAAGPSASPTMLPPAIARSRTDFVGREAELRTLSRTFEDAASGACRVVLLEGEAGVGKTRLAATFAEHCQRSGAVALYGRCDSQNLVPYQPFVEALRRYLAGPSLESLREAIPGHLTELAIVLPELGGEPRSAPVDGPAQEAERLPLFDAVSAVLCTIARPQAALLVLDDLHWADKPTLIMLRQVIRFAASAPLMVIGTYRESERTEPLLDMLADLRREHFYDRITLRGLDEDDAALLIRQLGDAGTPVELSRALWEESRGNPFFLEEMLRHRTVAGEGPATLGGSGSVPDGVKDVIGRRLARLSEDLRRVLEVACVIGSDFSVRILEQLCDLSEDALDAALNEAVDAHLIYEVPDTYGQFAFEHSLTRQTLLEELTLTRRARLHLRVGEELERLEDPDGAQLAQLAHHFLHAPPHDGLERALEYAARAARQAMNVLAYEEAARHYELALRALERLEQDGERRQGLLLALGDAQVKAGDKRRARISFREAADIARERGSARGLAMAALGVSAGEMSAGVVNEELVPLLEEALGALGESEGVLRSRLLARLAIELSFSREHVTRRTELTEEAVARARETGDANALSAALLSRHWSLWQPENVTERLHIATELLSLAGAAGDRRIEMQGHRWRMMDLLELGQIDEVDREMEAYATLARERRRPSELWYVRLYSAMRLLLSGRYEEAERESRAADEMARRIGDPNAGAVVLQMAVLRRDRGEIAELEEPVRQAVLRYPGIPAWRALLAEILVDAGRESEAREEFEHVAAGDFAGIPRDGVWLGAMACSAEVACALGDRERVATLYELLRPFPDRNVVIGLASSCLGSASRPLALLAGALNRRGEAAKHFQDALAMNERMGALPFLIRTRLEYAELLLDGAADERAVGVEHLQRALAEAAQLGLAPLAGRARSLLEARRRAGAVA
jgi:DNA-binding SARP family transcriptional activator/tetratricopeptide (TPR) repeat protein